LLVPLSAHRGVFNRHGFQDEGLALALGFGKWTDDDAGQFDARAVRAELRKLHAASERSAASAKVPAQLHQNIGRLADLVGLAEIDRRILEFAVMLQNERALDDTADYLGQLSSLKVYQTLAVVLGLPQSSVRAALEGQGMLARSGLLALERSATSTLRGKLNLLSDRFADHVSSSSADPISLLRDTVLPSQPGHLGLSDFDHLSASLEVLRPYLRKTLDTRRPGVNVLLYGSPGTGKNQFAKALTAELGCSLYEVSGEDADGDAVNGAMRLRAYRVAQSVLSRSSAVILFDEVEDVFEPSEPARGFGSTPAKGKKAWINRVLEGNPVPAFWLTNSIDNIDGAFLRRFDMVLELPVPPRRQREKIAHDACAGLLDVKGVARLAECEDLAPAVVARAASIVRFVADDLPASDPGKVLQRLIDQTLEAQGHLRLLNTASNALPDTYDPMFIHADTDLTVVAEGIARAGSARLCLYGPPGTGKTAWARWLASQLQKPLLVKRASDLMSMWVGGSEKQIARAFRRAEADGAVLLIDEVDSFLQERRAAKHSWEVTQVNEMLTQMESFGEVFIASTNLIEGLDEASLRRFDLKVRFDYLLPKQAWALLVRQAVVLGLSPPSAEDHGRRLNQLDHLTPGDFAAVARQHRFRPLVDTAKLVQALEDEVVLKRQGSARRMGFV